MLQQNVKEGGGKVTVTTVEAVAEMLLLQTALRRTLGEVAKAAETPIKGILETELVIIIIITETDLPEVVDPED